MTSKPSQNPNSNSVSDAITTGAGLTRPRQLRLGSPVWSPIRREHGGVLSTGRRKLARPLDPSRPLHLVLRSSRAKGKWSLLRPDHSRRTQLLLKILLRKYRVRMLSYKNSGNQLHLVVKFKKRDGFQGFLREFSGRLAFRVTEARKGNPVGRFWDGLAFTRVINEEMRVKDLLDFLNGSSLGELPTGAIAAIHSGLTNGTNSGVGPPG